MQPTIKSTKDVAADGVKLLVYGQSGAGKTTIIQTLPKPIILSAESGLLSLQDFDLPYIEIKRMADLFDAYAWLTSSEEAKQYASVALDSISEIAEVCLSNEKANSKDPRQAYGEMNDKMASLIRAFRDLPDRHVLMTAKLEKAQDEMGRMLYSPSMPGKALGQGLPYYFDFVFALRAERAPDGSTQRALMVESDGLWQAKQRGKKLEDWEAPDLGAIIGKLGG